MPRRRIAPRGILAALVLGVLATHLWLGQRWAQTLAHWKGAFDAEPPPPVQVSFVGSLQPTEPPPVSRLNRLPAPSPASPAAGAPLSTVAPPLPSPAASAPATPDAALPPELSQPVAEVLPALAAPAGAAPEAVAANDPWPPSTRIRYKLSGFFRGEFSGSAQVLWLRDRDRYQVHLEVVIGSVGAPLVARRIVSDGVLGPAGLTPLRYDEETKALFARTRLQTLRFLPGSVGGTGGGTGTVTGAAEGMVRLPDGATRPAPAGTQDSASQFVQLAWAFATQPELLQLGRTVRIPLALPRRSDIWTYEVADKGSVDTAAGPVEAWLLKPQRELDPLKRELLAEIWYAPSLQYLPVRMRVQVDAETFADLAIDGLPERAVVQLPPAPTAENQRLNFLR